MHHGDDVPFDYTGSPGQPTLSNATSTVIQIAWPKTNPALWQVEESTDAGTTWQVVEKISGNVSNWASGTIGNQYRITGFDREGSSITETSAAITLS